MALAIGIVMASFLSIHSQILFIAVILLLCILVWFNLFYRYSTSLVFGAGTHLLFIFIGMLVYVRANEKPCFYSSGIFCATVCETLQEKRASYQTELKVSGRVENDSVYNVSERIICLFAKTEASGQLEPGDHIFFYRAPGRIEHRNNPHEFDYRKYLERKGIYRQVYLTAEQWRPANLPPERSLSVMAERLRCYLLKRYQKQNLNDPGLEVLSALTLGYKRGLDPDTKRIFASAGVMHVLAVSGLHVGIVYLIFSMIFGFLNRGRVGRILFVVILISVLWLFAFVTGLSPSVKRSAAMFSFVVLGAGIHRFSNIHNTLAASAFFLLLFNPNNLFEAGFQLSYLAVFGIVFFQPRMEKLFVVRTVFGKYFLGLITVSLSAQFTTLPVTLFYFNQFPLYFFISNLVVIPAVTVLIPLGMILLLTSGFELLSSITSSIVGFLLHHLIQFLSFIERLPLAVVPVSLSAGVFFILLMVLIFLMLFIGYRKMRYGRICLALFLLMQIVVLHEKFSGLTKKEMIIYNYSGQTVVHLISGRENYIISETEIMETDYEQSLIMNTVRKLRLKSPCYLDAGKDYRDDHIYLSRGTFMFAGKIVSLGVNPVYGALYSDYVITPFQEKSAEGDRFPDQQFISNRNVGNEALTEDNKCFFLRLHGAFYEKW